MKINQKLMSPWERTGDRILIASVFTDVAYHKAGGMSSLSDLETLRIHQFLTLLAKLDLIQYERGYDGMYYDIILTRL